MPKFFISDEICYRVLAKMVELTEAQDAKGVLVQERATQSLLSACQTQARYNLKPQDASDFARHATIPRSEAKRLEEMTPDELLAEQERMMGGVTAGKPA